MKTLTGQWYLVFRRRIRPLESVVFQQKLHPSAGPSLAFGQCPNWSVVTRERGGSETDGPATGWIIAAAAVAADTDCKIPEKRETFG